MYNLNCKMFESFRKQNSKTAVFIASGATADKYVQATIDILTIKGFEAKMITAAEINAPGGLKDLDVILFPGGSGSKQASAMGRDGCFKVAQFIRNGGGYIGTCGGGYLGALGYRVASMDTSASSWLELVNADIIDVDHWNRGSGEPLIKITDPTHPILKGFSTTFKAHYFNGPLFKPGSKPDLPVYRELAVYVDDIFNAGDASPGLMPGKAALITSNYGKGRCVLFSFHPELTPGLEDMLIQAIQWVVKK